MYLSINNKQIQAKCLGLFPDSTVDSAEVENCVYDTAIAPNDAILVTSNKLGFDTANALLEEAGGKKSSSKGFSNAQITGLAVGLSVFAVFSVFVAFVMYHRLRKTQKEYNALVVYNNAQAANRNTPQAGLQLGNNL